MAWHGDDGTRRVLAKVSKAMGSSIPKVDSIVRAAQPAQYILEEFWDALTFLADSGKATRLAACVRTTRLSAA